MRLVLLKFGRRGKSRGKIGSGDVNPAKEYNGWSKKGEEEK